MASLARKPGRSGTDGGGAFSLLAPAPDLAAPCPWHRHHGHDKSQQKERQSKQESDIPSKIEFKYRIAIKKQMDHTNPGIDSRAGSACLPN
ncbi:hypothetical protein [Aeromonas rivipollensis]|uniref:hypothetical protein n=1 Tax=Aeromonas rivipollensis TaxID=948519 RepID=UPI0038D1AB64